MNWVDGGDIMRRFWKFAKVVAGGMALAAIMYLMRVAVVIAILIIIVIVAVVLIISDRGK